MSCPSCEERKVIDLPAEGYRLVLVCAPEDGTCVTVTADAKQLGDLRQAFYNALHTLSVRQNSRQRVSSGG